jgi:hypothetical protein
MAIVEINKDPTQRDLNWFELLLHLLLLGLGAYLYLVKELWLAAAVVAGLPVVLFLLFRAIAPARRWVYLGWIYATFPIGFVISWTMFIVLYFVILTPIGLLRRGLGRAALSKSFDRSRESYWQPIKQGDSVKRYFKQF